MTKDDYIYHAWREFEAYQVPLNEEGEYKMMRRWNAYKAGWLKALEASVKKDETLTRDWKDTIEERIARDDDFKESLLQEPYAYAYVREDGVGQLCCTSKDKHIFKDYFLEGWKEIPLYTKEKDHGCV